MSITSDIRVGIERQYTDQLAKGLFLIQRCLSCALHVFPPREICPHCGDDALAWVSPSGHGVVYSHTTVARKAKAGGDYNVVLVDLEEGVRMMSCVVESRAAISIGMAVTARVDRDEEGSRVVFVGCRNEL